MNTTQEYIFHEYDVLEISFGRSEEKSLIHQRIMMNDVEIITKFKKSVRNNQGKYRKDVIFSRLILGHTRLNDTLYTITKTMSDKCENCNCRENVECAVGL